MTSNAQLSPSHRHEWTGLQQQRTEQGIVKGTKGYDLLSNIQTVATLAAPYATTNDHHIHALVTKIFFTTPLVLSSHMATRGTPILQP